MTQDAYDRAAICTDIYLAASTCQIANYLSTSRTVMALLINEF